MLKSSQIPTYILILLSIAFLVPSALVSAQLPGISTEASLSVSPSTIAPQSVVTVSLEAYSINTTGATIRWFIDGSEDISLQNNRSISVEAGNLGNTTRVEARISGSNAGSFEVATALTPSMVDIVIEAETYVPTFYKGRALPTPGATIRAVAVPLTGSPTPARDYSYEWKLNNKVLFGGSIKGKYAAEIETPTFGGLPLAVTVYDNQNQVVGKKTIIVKGVNPEIHFYAENPLQGLGLRAIDNGFMLLSDELTVAAEPYFISTHSSDIKTYEWRVNGEAVENPSEEPRSLTLRKTEGAGRAQIAIKMTDVKNILQQGTGSFTIEYE